MLDLKRLKLSAAGFGIGRYAMKLDTDLIFDWLYVFAEKLVFICFFLLILFSAAALILFPFLILAAILKPY